MSLNYWSPPDCTLHFFYGGIDGPAIIIHRSYAVSYNGNQSITTRGVVMSDSVTQDLDRYMDRQDQAEAECNQELREAEDTAWGIHEYIDSAPKLLSADSSDGMDVIHQIKDHILTINIYMSEVESEVLTEYVRNHGSKFVTEKIIEEDL